MTNLSAIYGPNNSVKWYEKQAGSDGATSNTVFTAAKAYAVGYDTLMVFVNGQKAELVTTATNATEYEETDAYNVTFGASLQAADVVEFIVSGLQALTDGDFDTIHDSWLANNPTAGMKNKIINGDFDVWQRGTSFAAAVSGAYGADRWVHADVGGTLVYTVSKNVIVPSVAQSGHKSMASYQIEITTLEAAVAAGELLAFYQKIEGYNYKNLYGKTCTFSFWVNAVKTGIYCMSIRLGDASYSYVSEFTVNTTNTWEKKSVTVTFDQAATTPEFDTGIGLYVGVTLMCGATYQTTADAWQAGNFLATSNQVNGADATPNYFNITQVQLEAGSVASPFEHRSFTEEVVLCQRYFCKTYDIDVAPGTVTSAGRIYLSISAVASSIHTVQYHWNFPVFMRVPVATIGMYAPSDGAAASCDMQSGKKTCTAANQGMSGTRFYGSDLSAGTTRLISVHITADAEL